MKSFNKALEKFCFKHPRFGIRNFMRYIVIGNILVYLLYMMDRTGTIAGYLSFIPSAVLHGQVWRIVTFVFVPNISSNVIFLAIALYFYYIIGDALEREWGETRFTVYYLLGMLFTVVYGLICALFGFNFYADGAYINLSLFFAFATLYPNFEVLFFFILPIKMKWMALISAVFVIWGILIQNFPANLVPVVALINYVLFFSSDIADLVRRTRYRHSRNTVNFKSAARKVKKNNDGKMYVHKCEVCGRTDTEFPNLEFRYCSKCEGYHCYCADHINNHVHIK